MDTRLGLSLCWCCIGVEFSSKICPVIYMCLSTSDNLHPSAWLSHAWNCQLPFLFVPLAIGHCPLPRDLGTNYCLTFVQWQDHTTAVTPRFGFGTHFFPGRWLAWGHAVWQVVLQGKNFRVNEWANLPGREQSFGWFNPGTNFSPKWP